MIIRLSRPLLMLVLASCLADIARADALATPPAQAPDVVLRASTEQLCSLVKDHYADYKADPGKFYSAVDQVVVPHFDVPVIAQLVLAANYRTATPEQRARFAVAFKDMLVHAYGNAMLDNCKSVHINWMPPRLSANATEALVNTTLARDNGQAYAIGFRVHVVGDDWKIYDIAVENLSLVLNFRTQVNSEIKRTGLDQVIAHMQQGQFKSGPG